MEKFLSRYENDEWRNYFLRKILDKSKIIIIIIIFFYIFKIWKSKMCATKQILTED